MPVFWIIFKHLLAKFKPELLERHDVFLPPLWKTGCSTLFVHVVRTDDGKRKGMQHCLVPVLPADVLQVAVLDQVIDGINPRVRLKIELPCVVHFDAPCLLVGTNASISMLLVDSAGVQGIHGGEVGRGSRLEGDMDAKIGQQHHSRCRRCCRLELDRRVRLDSNNRLMKAGNLCPVRGVCLLLVKVLAWNVCRQTVSTSGVDLSKSTLAKPFLEKRKRNEQKY